MPVTVSVVPAAPAATMDGETEVTVAGVTVGVVVPPLEPVPEVPEEQPETKGRRKADKRRAGSTLRSLVFMEAPSIKSEFIFARKKFRRLLIHKDGDT